MEAPDPIRGGEVVARFEYPLEPGFELEPEMDAQPSEFRETGLDCAEALDAEASKVAPREAELQFEQLLASECRRAEDRGWERGRESGLEQGRQEGRAEAARQLQADVASERQRLTDQAAALLASFAEVREKYRDRLEQETARLALAIAARILRREVHSDPLALTGAVRVALGQLASTTVVRMRVPATDLELWREAIARMPNLPIRPEVTGDPGLQSGDCRLETDLGSADLGLKAQLEALERGFFSGGHEPSELAETNPQAGAEATERSLE